MQNILELCLILVVSSTAYCSIPFDYTILGNNVAPFETKAINFIPLPSHGPMSSQSLLEEFLKSRMPAAEYGPPKKDEMLFRPTTEPAKMESTTTEKPFTPETKYAATEKSEMSFMTTELPPMKIPKVYLPPGLPELPPAPEIPSTTTTTTTESTFMEKKMDKEEEEERKPAEEYGVPTFDEISFMPPPKTDMKVTVKKYLPPGLPELPPEPEFPSTMATEDLLDKETNEMNKPKEEYSSPTKDDMLFKPYPEPKIPKVYLPPGLPDLPPAPEISLMTTESSYEKETPKMEEMIIMPAEEYSEEMMPEKMIMQEIPVEKLPEPSLDLPKRENEPESPENEYSFTKDGNNFNFKISVTSNSNSYPPLPYFFAPHNPQFFPYPSAPYPPQIPAIPTPPPSYGPPITETKMEPTTLPQAELMRMPEMEIMSEMNKDAPYPAPEIIMAKTTLEPATYPPATTELPPMIISQEIKHYIPPTPSIGAPYPPPLPYSTYGHL
ncbi:uncharacterized protein LOC129610408 [Condylostylus longicornis]|uniref:uncharacterized protein LOC129610408 n=1 Tax=Condylostylus longicornis TaxID=2530218 RepID=UPI00244D9CF8|nr:uncharacterized protein LOC129610408 [Condylostylus longicornis]